METVLRDIASKVGLVLECQRGLIDAAAWADQVFRERCVLFQIGDAKAFALISTIVLEALLLDAGPLTLCTGPSGSIFKSATQCRSS